MNHRSITAVLCAGLVALIIGGCAADDNESSADEPATSTDEAQSVSHWYRVTIPSNMCGTQVDTSGVCSQKFPPEDCWRRVCPDAYLRDAPNGNIKDALGGGDKVFVYEITWGGWAHVGWTNCRHGHAIGGWIPTKYLPRSWTTPPNEC
jgi:hypothetical protein